ncbi:MAG: hypothetical protein GW763_08835 [Paraglaciecola sp.]|nr:hypothetical protein [Paraglaciecola sp.]NCT48078.1 hypothetical protein [Paraglaciecola sp.]
MLISAISANKSPAALIQVLYAAFVNIQQNLDRQIIDERFVDKLDVVAKHLVVVAKHHADALFAQPHLSKPHFPNEVNLRFNFTIFCLLFCIRNKMAEGTVVQLLKAAMLVRWQETHVSPEAANEQTTETQRVMQNDLVAKFAEQGEDIVTKLLSLPSNIMSHRLNHFSQATAQSDYQQIFVLAGQLANLTLSSGAQKTLHFSQALRLMCQHIPTTWLDILRPLMHYPGMLPTGTCIQDKQGITSMVVAINDHGVWVKTLATKTSTPHSSAVGYVARSEVVRIYAPLKLTRFAQIDTWFAAPLDADSVNDESMAPTPIAAWPIRFAINKPPPSLLDFQHEMLGNNPDIKKMAAIITREPSFVAQIQQAASHNNRLKQLVETPLHGLLVNGLLPSSRMLWQHSVLSRLSQESFPLKHDLLMFCQLYCYIVEQLSAPLMGDDAQDIKMMALFRISSLMLEPTLRHAIRWHVIPQQTYLLAKLHGGALAPNTNNMAVKLAKAWQQSPKIINILLSVERDMANFALKKKVDTECCILGLGLMLGREVMFAEKALCPLSIEFANYAQKHLGLNQLERATLVERCLAKLPLSCDLN